MRKSAKTLTTLAFAGALALGASACGGNSDSSSTGSSSTPSATSSAPSATAAPTPAAALSDLSKGVSTAVTLDAGFVSALGSLKLTPAPVGKGTISKEGVATFPITGGNVTYYDPASGVVPYVQGKINHEGSGLSLTDGTTKVELTNFVVDPGTSVLTGDVSANGKSVVKGAPLFDLDGTTLKPLQTEGDNAILEGTQVKLTQAAADLLNMTYKVDALKGGFLIGVAKITVATK
jgi:hypothetical protein